MIITLNQDQIEDAIRDYVGARLTIAEDQRLDIDLKATRGEGGYTAVIEVNNADSPRATSSASTSNEPAAATASVAPKNEPQNEAKDAPAPKAEAADAKEDAEPAPEKAAAPKKSIFAGVKKSANASADTEETEAA